jgi:hypothetical protein
MRPLGFPHDAAVDRLCRQVDEFAAAARSVDDMGLLAPSRCVGWSRLEVVVHVRMGLAEMAVGTTLRTDAAPDHDAASYWHSHPDDRDDDQVPHILWLRRVASAHSRPSGAVTHLEAVAEAAKGAVRAMPTGAAEYQGKRMLTGDFLATWVVELAVHQLDLALDDEPSGTDWARQTLEALAERPLPAALDDHTAVLVGLGRIPCPATTSLDPAFPLAL